MEQQPWTHPGHGVQRHAPVVDAAAAAGDDARRSSQCHHLRVRHCRLDFVAYQFGRWQPGHPSLGHHVGCKA
uniref:Uncharacterized protein n=1 Tax=Steinernema glaseri TaxID=37863 RepID=A0A1I8A0J0_9BILA